MRPPAPSISPATSPSPRRSVPLKSMCSWKWATPCSPARSSAEPTRAQIWSSTTGARSVWRSSTVSPFGSCSQSDRALAHDSARQRTGAAGRGARGAYLCRVWTTSASTSTCRSASASARTATSRWSRRARSGATRRRATSPRCSPSSPRAATISTGSAAREPLLRRRHAVAAARRESVARADRSRCAPRSRASPPR